MADIVGVKFKNNGKVYYFNPGDLEPELGSKVIVETAQGMECGEIAMPRREIADDQLSHELKDVVRIATADDLRQVEENAKKEEKAFSICEERIAAHGLDMKLVSVEYAFDSSKILFNFTADGRVDFRELVKDLAGIFRTRIELRQIGVRDEAKMLGGLGVCGRPFCCKQFMDEFVSVSIKMAKEQGLSLNPTKISGTCGRLMCCLKHEEDSYKCLLKNTPRIGTHVHTPDGNGVIVDSNLLTGMLSIRLDDAPEGSLHPFHKKYMRALDKNGQPEQADEDIYADDIARAPEEERAAWRTQPEDDFRQVIAGEEDYFASAQSAEKPLEEKDQPQNKQSGQRRQGDRRRQGGKPGGQNKQGGQQKPNAQNKQGGQNKPNAQNKQGGQQKPNPQNKQGGQQKPNPQQKQGDQNKQSGQHRQGGQHRPNGQHRQGGNHGRPYRGQQGKNRPNDAAKPQGGEQKPSE